VENDYFINKMNISHYKTLLRTNLDDEKRAAVGRLLAELETNHTIQSHPGSSPKVSSIV
jgi:hypothetical protein